MVPAWSPRPPTWSPDELSLLPVEIPDQAAVPLPTFLEASERFPRKFPVDSNRCKTLKSSLDDETQERNINSAYPILHENIFNFYARFILHKRLHGNDIEKAVYKNMNLSEFVDRLLKKRAVTFMGKRDLFTLLDGSKGSQKWETIGTLNQKTPLVLENCLSYEEIKLSAFLSVSSYTYFVNIGDRKNFAVPESNRSKIQDEGIIMGIIGSRLVKEKVMEYQELVITESQNTKRNGYGNVTPPTIHHLFADLYEEKCLEYADIAKNDTSRYTPLKGGEILDNCVHYKRLVFTMDTLFLEANQRALERNTHAYIHVVGIGLGVWRKTAFQNKLFMDACGRRIKLLGEYLHNVSDVCFAYISHNKCLAYQNGDTIPIEGHSLGGIKLHMSKREPHSKLTGADAGKLLVVSYAWDGNAFPGNEYWDKKLGSSGDSAAASSTQITELHNPFINPKVCANNLKIVTGGSVMGLREYVEKTKKYQTTA